MMVAHVARKGLGVQRCVATLRRLVADERLAGGAYGLMAMGMASKGVQLSTRVRVVGLEPTSLHPASTAAIGTCPERRCACASGGHRPLLGRHNGVTQAIIDRETLPTGPLGGL